MIRETFENRSMRISKWFRLRNAWNLRRNSSYQPSPMMRRSKELRQLISTQMPVIFFLHVPKTGGTDLAIKLQQSMRFNVFSLDAPEEDYLLQLKWFNPDRPTFIRAHIYASHAWHNFLKWRSDLEVFTILRNPYSLHVSLATMLLDRMLFKANRDTPTEKLEISQDEYVKKLQSVVESPGYIYDYQHIYVKYFGFILRNSPLMSRLRVIGIDQVDSLQQRLIPGDPVLGKIRLNQSRFSLGLTSSELLNSDFIISLSQLVSADEISLYHTLQSKVGDLDWALCSQPFQPA